jgi:hypothetical protein
MRDRLVELLSGKSIDTPVDVEYVADCILEDGWIRPPCKVGDTVYTVNRKPLASHWDEHRYIIDEWDEYKVCEIPFSLTLWECGWDKVVLTKEQAEQKLKEMRVENG